MSLRNVLMSYLITEWTSHEVFVTTQGLIYYVASEPEGLAWETCTNVLPKLSLHQTAYSVKGWDIHQEGKIFLSKDGTCSLKTFLVTLTNSCHRAYNKFQSKEEHYCSSSKSDIKRKIGHRENQESTHSCHTEKIYITDTILMVIWLTRYLPTMQKTLSHLAL